MTAKILLMCLTFIGGFRTSPLFAQFPNSKNPDENYSSQRDEDQKTTLKYRSLILKTGLFSWPYGRQMVELEKEVNDYISLQGGIGITFSKRWLSPGDALKAIGINVDLDGYCESTQWEAGDVCDLYFDHTYRKLKPGIWLSVSSRLFFLGDGFEGMYLAPAFRYSTQNFKIQKVVENQIPIERDFGNWQPEKVKNTDIMLHFGRQRLFPRMSLEWFMGLGVRFTGNLRQDIGYTNTGLQNGERKFKENAFRVESGWRVGFQL